MIFLHRSFVLPVVSGLLGVAVPLVGVAAPVDRQAATLTTPGTSQILALPEAADHAPVISLGTATDPQTGKTVDGFAIIHYKSGGVHKPNHGGGGGGTITCYAFLASGAKWKNVEPWVVNPANITGLDGPFVAATLATDVVNWEDAADGVMGNGGSVNVLGDGATTSDPLSADTQAPDGVNEAYFADVSSSGAIAVTIVWGVFSGPPFQRQLVEWDQVYDDVDFAWSATGGPGKMDFENIAMHELGHAFGMGHPSDSCTEETMYRFAAGGETKKRTLNSGDIAGIDKLY